METVIKHLSFLLVKDVGGIEAAASLTRLSKSRIQQCISRNNSDSFLPIDVIYTLEAHSDTSYFPQMLSGARNEEAGPTNDRRMTSHFVSLSAYFGRVMEEYGTALEHDEIVSAEEAKIILGQAAALRQSITNIEANLMRIIAMKERT